MSRDGLAALIPRHVPLNIGPARLNALLQDAVAGQRRITAASIVCEEGSFRLQISLNLAGAGMVCSTRLGLDATLAPQQRVITLRRLSSEHTRGTGPVSMAMAWLINTVLLGHLDLDLLGIGLRAVDGLRCDRSRIIIDFDRLGLTDSIRAAMAAKITSAVSERLPGGIARLALQNALPAFAERSSAAALDHLQIANIRITASEGLSGDLMLAGMESVVLQPPGAV